MPAGLKADSEQPEAGLKSPVPCQAGEGSYPTGRTPPGQPGLPWGPPVTSEFAGQLHANTTTRGQFRATTTRGQTKTMQSHSVTSQLTIWALGLQQPRHKSETEQLHQHEGAKFLTVWVASASMSPIQGKVNWGTSADSSNRRPERRDNQGTRKNYLGQGRTTIPKKKSGTTTLTQEWRTATTL